MICYYVWGLTVIVISDLFKKMILFTEFTAMYDRKISNKLNKKPHFSIYNILSKQKKRVFYYTRSRFKMSRINTHTVVNFTNVFRAAFRQFSCAKKNKSKLQVQKNYDYSFHMKKLLIKFWWNWYLKKSKSSFWPIFLRQKSTNQRCR